MNLPLIKANLELQLRQVKRIETLMEELEVIKTLPYYEIMVSGLEEQILDISDKEAEIAKMETVLIGMMK